ncbi:MAG: Zn-dependent hydrolase [Bulleidia sp.]|nr:Zn-dependent hydrolase [Bulleidia sp.]
MKQDDISYVNASLHQYHDIGAGERGVTRPGYSETENQMHTLFTRQAESLGLTVYHDCYGNSYASFAKELPVVLIASHLDSVVEGGRFDGPAGVITGLLIQKWNLEEHAGLPVTCGALRCEESSRFGHATIGSGLATGQFQIEDAGAWKDSNGITLAEELQKHENDGPVPDYSRLQEYLELHIEQGRVLEESRKELGIVTSIAGNHRIFLDLKGMAEHSGATPMNLRNDALCAAAEVILAVEHIAEEEWKEHSVGTVGVVENHPNVMNVVPGETKLRIDLRSQSADSLARMEEAVLMQTKQICERRGITLDVERITRTQPVMMNKDIAEGLMKACEAEGNSGMYMPSGAGHDAMHYAEITHAGMVFIPCLHGISHNPAEHAEAEDIVKGARAMYAYLKEEFQ